MKGGVISHSPGAPITTDPSGNPAGNMVVSGTPIVAQATSSDGGSVALATATALLIGDLTPYGYPYASLTLTNAGANTATIVWGTSNGMFYFQIAGTTPDIDLTATNKNEDVFTDVPVQVLGVQGSTTGQTLGAGHFVLYKN